MLAIHRTDVVGIVGIIVTTISSRASTAPQ